MSNSILKDKNIILGVTGSISCYKSVDLASKLNINGTPAFIIGDKIIPYAISFEELKKLVNKESNS